MDFGKLWECAKNSTDALMSGWIAKTGLAAILAIIQFHVELFFLFNILVVLDLFSKWLALARPLCECNPPSVWHEFKMIPEAHRRGIISSDEMKTRFLGKILIYSISVLASGAADLVLVHFGRAPQIVSLCISYLAVTELLSVIENLDTAGVSAVSDLAGMIKKLRGRA